MTITQLCEKVNVYCAKLNSIVTARGGIYFFILGVSKSIKKCLTNDLQSDTIVNALKLNIYQISELWRSTQVAEEAPLLRV